MDAITLRQKRDKAPYDDSITVNFKMYDSFPYSMDIDICPRDSHLLFSGNVIKANRYILDSDFLINHE